MALHIRQQEEGELRQNIDGMSVPVWVAERAGPVMLRGMASLRLSHPSRRQFLTTAALGAVSLGWGHRLRADTAAMLPGGRKLGVALVGLGGYAGGQLAPALRETRWCELRGVVTGDPEGKGRRWATEYGFSQDSVYSYETMDRIAEDPNIDIVYCVTPPGLHLRDVKVAAAAGKHVICEKPMAVSVAECDEMIAACEAAGVRLSMGYRLHFHPYHQRIKAAAAEGRWGGPVAMTGGFAYRMGNPNQWRLNKALAGGGQLLNVGIYVFQSACMAMGEEMPVRITAQEEPKRRPEMFREVEDTMRFQLEWADGSRLEGVSSGDFNQNDFRAVAAGRSMSIEPAHSYGGLRMAVDGKPLAPLKGFNQQAHQMDAFAEAILRDEPSVVPGAMGRRDMALVEAIYAAAASGEAVNPQV